jgi:hypothetical protein
MIKITYIHVLRAYTNQALRDLRDDFGFEVGPWNQAYRKFLDELLLGHVHDDAISNK